MQFQIKSNFRGASITRSIRFTPQLFERLEQTAASYDISFNLLVLQCCQYALDSLISNPDEEVQP